MLFYVSKNFIMRLMLFIVVLFLGIAQNSSSACDAPPSLEEMIGSMIMVGFRGSSAPSDILEAIQKGRLGGIILFDRDVNLHAQRNILDKKQLQLLTKSLQKSAPHPIFIAVDQEGGRVRRLEPGKGFFALPSAQEMGDMSDSDVKDLAYAAGREMTELGINVDLAPVADIRRSAKSPGLGDFGRTFSSDSAAVYRKSKAFSAGLRKAGVIPVLKHFPGLGSASLDSHKGLPDVTDVWNDIELFPYRELFKNSWQGMVLAAHAFNRNLDKDAPSSLSSQTINGLLRDSLRWQGVVITDDLQMDAVSGIPLRDLIKRAVDAGTDILLFGNNLRYEDDIHTRVFSILMNLVQSGDIEKKRIQSSWRRIDALKRTCLKEYW